MTTERLLAIGEVAHQLGLPRRKLAYLIERRGFPGPSLLVCGRRLFTCDDLRRLRQRLQEYRQSRYS